MASGIRVLINLESMVEDALEGVDTDDDILYDVTLDISNDFPVYTFMIVFPSRLEAQHRCYVANFATLIPTNESMVEWVDQVVAMNDEAHAREAGMLHLN